MSDRITCGGLFQRRLCLVPTWRGWLVLVVTAGLGFYVWLRTVHGFLAVTALVPAEVLVVEGWATDFQMQEALAENRRSQYAALYVTGGPIETGSPFAESRSYAEFGAERLRRLIAHLPRNEGPPPGAAARRDATNLVAVPAPAVRQDRTFNGAVALREWLRQRGSLPRGINIVSGGAHARRTRLLYEKAFGPGVAVGIRAAPDERYDAAHWWQSSQGVRTVIDEFVAYLYARLAFWPPAPAA